jgi:hypothetical protein
MSTKRLFVFGYESPAEFQSNLENGTDFESSAGVWITSASEQDAAEWGRTVAERFVVWLFEREGHSPYSWISGQFVHWIESDPNVLAAAADLPIVPVGEIPDFALLTGRHE